VKLNSYCISLNEHASTSEGHAIDCNPNSTRVEHNYLAVGISYCSNYHHLNTAVS
jgi:hypothetical protein